MIYNTISENTFDNINYLSELLREINEKIDKILGKHTYMDMYVENKNIVIIVEEEYFSQIENIVRNHYVSGLNYQSAYYSTLAYQESINLVEFEIV